MKRFKILLLVLLTTLTVSLVAVGVITGLEKQSSEVPPIINNEQNGNEQNNIPNEEEVVTPPRPAPPEYPHEVIGMFLGEKKKFTLKFGESAYYKVIMIGSYDQSMSDCTITIKADEPLRLRLNYKNIYSEEGQLYSENNQFKVQLTGDDNMLWIFGSTLREQEVELLVEASTDVDNIKIKKNHSYLVAYDLLMDAAVNITCENAACFIRDIILVDENGRNSYPSYAGGSLGETIKDQSKLTYSALLRKGKYYINVVNTSDSDVETQVSVNPVEELFVGQNDGVKKAEGSNWMFYKFEAIRGSYKIYLDLPSNKGVDFNIFDENWDPVFFMRMDFVSEERNVNFIDGTYWIGYKISNYEQGDETQIPIVIEKGPDDYLWKIDGKIVQFKYYLERGKSYKVEFFDKGVSLPCKLLIEEEGCSYENGVLTIAEDAQLNGQFYLSPRNYVNSYGQWTPIAIEIIDTNNSI